MFNIDPNTKKFSLLKGLCAVALLLFSQSAFACHWYQAECLAKQVYDDAVADAKAAADELAKQQKQAQDFVESEARLAEQAIITVASLLQIVRGEDRSSVHGQPVITPGGADWMAGLPDARKLSQLTIPGTHDTGTGALHLGVYSSPTAPPLCVTIGGVKSCVPENVEKVALTAMQGALVETQYWTVAQQLENGIRFLDIRVGDYTDGSPGFALYHGPILVGDFNTDVMIPVNDFLKQHAKEVILMSVKNENALDKVSFNSTVILPNNFITTAKPDTTLGEVRGKVVLFNRMDNVNDVGGVDWQATDRIGTVEVLADFPPPPGAYDCIAIFDPIVSLNLQKCSIVVKGTINIQDKYENEFLCQFNNTASFPWTEGSCDAGEGAKTTAITDQLLASAQDTTGTKFYVNFASAQMNVEGKPTALDIVGNAKTQNERLVSNFMNYGAKPCTGQIIVMDYPGFVGIDGFVLETNELLSSMIGVNTNVECP